MAAPTPGPSRITTDIVTYTPQSAPDKLRIIRRVATKVIDEISGTAGRRPKAVEFTGLHPDLIERLENTKLTEIELKVRETDRSVIYNYLMDFFLHEKIIPTTFALFLKVFGKIPIYTDIGEFRNYLFKHGFMWKQILKGTFVVMERPQVIFVRHFYLKNIQRYRKEEKPIYFLDEIAFDTKGNILTMKQSMSCQNESQIRVICAVSDEGAQFKQFINDFSSETFLKWIKETLLMSLTTPSVIVLNNYKHHCEELLTLPNEDSTKRIMCDWLEYFNVPYDPEMTKNVLYELIQNYTDFTQKMYVVDNVLRLHGHTVLRLPDCIRKLTPATYYFDVLSVNMLDLLKDSNIDLTDIMSTLTSIIDTLNEEHAKEIKEICNVVAAEEKTIIFKDEALDNMMDELEDAMRKSTAEYNGLDSDLPSDESDSE